MDQKRRVTAMRVRPNTYGEIMKRKSPSFAMSDAGFRSMLVSLKPGCYVETSSATGGSIVKVERDRSDIPVIVQVESKVYNQDDKVIDVKRYRINVGDIVFWEPWDFIAPTYLFEEENAPIGEIMFASEVT